MDNIFAQLAQMPANKMPQHCRGCAYLSRMGRADQCCDYLIMTGRPRPCPVEGCTAWAKKAEKTEKGKRKRRWTMDTKKAMEMYNAGATDREISKALGVSAATICAWRKDAGLPSKHKRAQRDTQTPEDPETPEPTEEPEAQEIPEETPEGSGQGMIPGPRPRLAISYHGNSVDMDVETDDPDIAMAALGLARLPGLWEDCRDCEGYRAWKTR